MALEDIFEEINFVDKITKPDGLGGTITTWQEGASFKGSITLDTSIESRVAEQQGVTNLYTVITNDNIELVFNDIIRRKSDLQTFKIKSLTNKENSQPSFATKHIRVATAEITNLK